jgi:phosphoglycerol transferase
MRCARALGPYILALALCLLILVWVLQLWRADLSVPLYYEGDSLLVQTWIKGGIDNRWYGHNHYLGMPAGQKLYDWPSEITATSVFLALKLLSLAIPRSSLVLNLYYLATYPLVTLSAFFVLRRFGLSVLTATAISLLFTFLPYHLGRNEAHLFLSGYYLVPPTILVAAWLQGDGAAVFFPQRESGKYAGFPWPAPRGLASLAISALLGLGQVYYAFFACYLFAVAGTAASLRRRHLGSMAAATILIAVVSLGVAAGLVPSVVYRWKHGPNPEAHPRNVADAEANGLKISQLLLPVQGHRIQLLKRLRLAYDHTAPLCSENGVASVGVIGSIGFLILIGRLLYRPSSRRPGLLDALSLLNVFAVLLGTIGGFGAVFAMVVSPRIRCYNRVSIYIAFLALCAVGMIVERVGKGRRPGWYRRVLRPLVLGILLTLGLLDQTSSAHRPLYTAVASDYRNDEAFVAAIEAAVPPRTRIAQLPYVAFPETLPVERLGDYDLLRGYLHSRTLRWSFGAMKGRPADQWFRTLAALPPKQMVEALAAAGFGGIYVDRLGFADSGAALVAALTKILRATPLQSGNGRLVFFDLCKAPHRTAIKSTQASGVALAPRDTGR